MSHPSIEAQKKSQLKLLIVDDEPDLAELLSLWLEKRFEFIHMVNSSKEAMEYFRKECVDVLITDMRMPDGTGIDVVQTAFEEHRCMAAIVMTGYDPGSLPDLKKVRQYPVFYLAKPFEFSALDKILDMIQGQKISAAC